jgi:hypothetical protein
MKISIDQVSETYNGKPGCMCGCNGSYKDSVQSKRIAVKKINAALSFIGPNIPTHKWVPLGFLDRVLSAGYDNECAWLETSTRKTVIYFKDPLDNHSRPQDEPILTLYPKH